MPSTRTRANHHSTTTKLSDDEKFTLIHCVKNRPILWDVANKDYRATHLKGAEWKNVSLDMRELVGRDFEVHICKDQWDVLRRQYNNNKNQLIKRGSGANELMSGALPSWRFYAPMLFLDNNYQNVQTNGTYVIVREAMPKHVDEHEEEEGEQYKPNIVQTRTAHKNATKMPSTSSRKRRAEPELDQVETVLAKLKKPVKEFDPLAQMVDQMMVKIGQTGNRRAQLDFKQSIMRVLDHFDTWLISVEEEEEESG